MKQKAYWISNGIMIGSSIIMVFFIMPHVLLLNKGLLKYDKFYFLGFLFIISIIVPVLLSVKEKNSIEKKILQDGIQLFFASISFRIIIILMLGINTNQISDFGYAFEQSISSVPLYSEYYGVFSNWALYSEYLRILNIFFGENIFNGIVSNMILSSLSAVLIYYLIITTTQERKWAYLSAMLFTLWPSNIYSTILLTPEYLHILFMLLSHIILFKIFKKYNELPYKKILFLSLITGVLFSVSGFFKPIDKIAYVAILILGAYLTIDKKIKIKKSIIIWFAIIGTSVITSSCIYLHLDSYIGIEVNRDPKMPFLYVGLTPKGVGAWTKETSIYFDVAKEHNFDYKRTDQIIQKQLIKEIKETSYNKIIFFVNKIKIAWGSDIYPSMVNATISDDAPIKRDIWIERIRAINEIYYLLILTTFFVSIAMSIYGKKDLSYLLLFYSFLIVFGFFCLLCISEVQDRYKLVIYPYLSIVSGRIGIYHPRLNIKTKNKYF